MKAAAQKFDLDRLDAEISRIDSTLNRLLVKRPTVTHLLEREYIRGKLDGIKFALELVKTHKCGLGELR